MNVRYLVVHKRETDPWEVYPFEDRDDADRLYAYYSTQWTGTLLVQVLRDASVQSDQQPTTTTEHT